MVSDRVVVERGWRGHLKGRFHYVAGHFLRWRAADHLHFVAWAEGSVVLVLVGLGVDPEVPAMMVEGLIANFLRLIDPGLRPADPHGPAMHAIHLAHLPVDLHRLRVDPRVGPPVGRLNGFLVRLQLDPASFLVVLSHLHYSLVVVFLLLVQVDRLQRGYLPF